MPDAKLPAAISGHLDKVLQLQQIPHADAVQELGRNCHMRNALQTPMHAVLHHEWLVAQQQQQHQQQQDGSSSALHGLCLEAKQRVFVTALREVMLAGGAVRAGQGMLEPAWVHCWAQRLCLKAGCSAVMLAATCSSGLRLSAVVGLMLEGNVCCW
jgi:hypothetical protein